MNSADLDNGIADRNAKQTRWLSIIGIGEDGREGLSAAANRLIDAASLVAGGARHLSLVGPVSGEKMVWASPFRDTFPAILARRGEPVCVLASGDPFWFGAGASLAEQIAPAEMIVLPAPSSFSLAAARLGWALQNVVTMGLHAERIETVLRHLHNGRRLLLLAANGAAPGEIARLLTQYGFEDSAFYVMEALGGPRENIHQGLACDFPGRSFAALNIVAVELKAAPEARVIPFAAGLPDDYFEHDGQITKREVRAITLSALRPGAGELLWDIGLGCGSIAIEWLLSHPSNKAIGFEKSATRLALAVKNAAVLGVPSLEVRKGMAPDILKGAAPPDAVFIGGGLSKPGTADACWDALKPGGRMVCNAVTFAGQTVLFQCRERRGGQLIRIGIEREHALGSHTGWLPAMPVMQWSAVKPWP